MKNLILLFFLIGTTILLQAQTQDCCDPCPPECCIAVCDTKAKTNASEANMQSAKTMAATKMAIQVLCKSVPGASCSNTKVKAYTESTDNQISTVETLPQTIAMVDGPSVIRSVSSQIPTPLYKGEQ